VDVRYEGSAKRGWGGIALVLGCDVDRKFESRRRRLGEKGRAVCGW
jgi:hypothetical protein